MTKPRAQSKLPTRRHQKTVAVGGVISKRLAVMGLGQDAIVTKLLTNWPQLCPLLAHVTQPVSCVKGTLKIAVKSDSVKQELRYHSPALIALINQLLGFEGVSKITASTQPFTPVAPGSPSKSHQNPTPSAPPNLATAEEACKAVADPDLREALTRLGSWCLTAGDGKKKAR